MLTYLHIADLGVIGDATIEPATGLTAVTGETGAGKTLVVTGLGLLLGQRADAGMVRQGSAKAVVDGGFLGVEGVAGRLDELGAELGDPPELVVSRQVTAQGRTRAGLGGVAVPLGVLDEVVGALATIHGQSEQVRLATPERARQVLDQAGGAELAAVLAKYRAAYSARRAAVTERDDLVTQVQMRAREADMLRFGLAEIEKVAPEPGEDDSLAVEARRLQDVDDLRGLAASADAALSGDDETPGAVGLIGQARKALERLAQHDETTLDLSAESVAALDVAQGLAGEVASYLASLDADPVRLEAIAARQAELQGLTRKYGTTVDEVLEWARVSSARLGQLVGSDERIAELNEQITQLDGQLGTLAAQITARRAQAGGRLGSAVADELAALAMPHAALEFEMHPLTELGPWGAESVQLLFTANPGAPLAPIGKVASGGELSRLRLAIEVVLADLGAGTPAPGTFVFDEVDAGVGGAVGLEIGRRLARLAKDSQVLVVTHLAQVAAWADRHFVVAKSDDGAITTAGVFEVVGDARVSEIARMMGGLSDSQAGLGHARDLLAAARRD
ncbi:MAG: DNA repair protein RecN [Propionibacteriaceae bacterium]|nr:DNA repair protein RecN [Propionibacteriaceae bacterium]